MNNLPLLSPAETEATSAMRQAANIWQSKIDNVAEHLVPGLARTAIAALNQRLEAEMPVIDEPVFYSGDYYFTDRAHNCLRQDDTTVNKIHYGFSEGIKLATVEGQDGEDVRLVHALSLASDNFITVGRQRRPVNRAFLPIGAAYFRVLTDPATAFLSGQKPDDNHCPEVTELAQYYSLHRQPDPEPGTRAEAKVRLQQEDFITSLEKLVGYPGSELKLRADYAYTLDPTAEQTLSIYADSTLRRKVVSVTFLGIGDFKDLQSLGYRVNLRCLDGDHDGLYMAVSLSNQANHLAGLSRQAILVPLSGNNLRYFPA